MCRRSRLALSSNTCNFLHINRGLVMSRKSLTLFDSALIGPAVVDAFKKLDPRIQLRSPVMFVVFVGSIITTLLFFQAIFGQGEASPSFIGATSVWLWFT